jgi:Uma2 family endonuclease
MTQVLGKVVTFDEFVAKYPDNTGQRYELYDGVVVEMPQPTGDHEEIVVFLSTKITLEYSRVGLRYGIPKGEYRVSKFRGDERIESSIFPELDLTAEQIFQACTVS